MLQLFPFIAWLAAATSLVLLIALWSLGELQPRSLAVLVGCFALAMYCQFFARSGLLAPVGLVLQTMLAIYLVLRWRLTS